MKGIEITNVSKSYHKTKRKLWYQQLTKEENPDENVRYEYRNRGLYKSLKKTTQALNNVNFRVEEGEIIGLLGPNGAGKTTLAKIMSTLVLPDQGTVKLHGYDVVDETVKARFSLGLVTGGERSLYWKLTPYQNLRFFGSLYGMTSTETEERSKELIKTFGITNKADTLVQDLSTGYKMKTAFARSLMHDPPVLILDEYNRGLDPNASRQLRSYIKEELQIKRRKTIVVMTHSMDIAQELCDRIILIDQGEKVAEGTPSELKGDLEQQQIIEIETREKISNGKLEPLTQFGSIDYGSESTNVIKLVVDKNPTITYQILDYLNTMGIEVVNFNLSQPNLEDVFMTYTGKKLEDDLIGD